MEEPQQQQQLNILHQHYSKMPPINFLENMQFYLLSAKYHEIDDRKIEKAKRLNIMIS